MERHQAELALEAVERRRPHVPQRDGRQANPPCVQLGEQSSQRFLDFREKLYLIDPRNFGADLDPLRISD
jgi:hypothetical protein